MDLWDMDGVLNGWSSKSKSTADPKFLRFLISGTPQGHQIRQLHCKTD